MSAVESQSSLPVEKKHKHFRFGKQEIQKDMKENIQPDTKKLSRNWWKWILVGILGVIVASSLITATLINRYIIIFEAESGVSVEKLVNKLQQARGSNLFEGRESYQILLYGIDQVQNRPAGSTLTDSLMLISIKPNGAIKLVSIPRDLWINSLKTKINAVYYYGELSEETSGEQLLKSIVEEISGQSIDATMRLDLDLVVDMVDVLGGVEVQIEEGFIDEQFPRDDVAISNSDQARLYETVKFEAGTELMTGERVEKFIRSRHSQNEEEGTDIGRSGRQQQVLKAVVERMQSREVLLDPQMMGRLYKLWSQLETTLSDEIIMGLGLALRNSNLNMESEMMIQADELEGELLMVPTVAKYRQWVYEPLDPSWQQIHEWFNQVLR